MKLFNLLGLTICCICAITCRTDDRNQDKVFSIEYEKFTLANGLEVVLHEDHSDPIVAVATLVHVGSNREKPGRTGFAHFFEHMSFNDSENVPRGANRKLIPEWGGQRNGGTWSDGTIYYEVVPKDAFEKILWIDSDRLGFMINTVTEEALEREKQVVKNEKRQRVDNSPYGFTNEIIRKNLYPSDHPYSWTVIGELEDLQAATIEDVKEFYEKYYGASNATLVIAGDIDPDKTKELVNFWFGEIRRGPDVDQIAPMPVELENATLVYYEDNFAKLPQLNMVFPTVEKYHVDSYALQAMGELLSGTKKSPLYKVIVESKKYAPNVSANQRSNELAGEFTIRIQANEGIDLDSVKSALEEGFNLFESGSFTDNELIRIKAEMETRLYKSIETVLDKAFTLVQDNEFIGDPAYIVQYAKIINDLKKEDIIRVYDQYIKGKNYVLTSVVPKGQLDLIVSNSTKAEVYEEKIVTGLSHEEVGQGMEAQYLKTPTKFDRSEPEFGELPLFETPKIWTSKLENTGIPVYGIENDEIPLVSFDISIEGGHMLDDLQKPGVASLMADLMIEGTKEKTSEELEEAIGLLGSSIDIYCRNEEIRISGNCLSKNFEATIDLVEEIIIAPRWDEQEYERLMQAQKTRLKGSEANPRALAYNNFMKQLYGNEHILGYPISGTLSSAEHINLETLQEYYDRYFGSNMAKIHVAGMIGKERVVKAFSDLDKNWEAKSVTRQDFILPNDEPAGKMFFIDVPNSKQSVIYLGKLVLPATDENYNNLVFANEVLGGGPSGMLFQTLRIEKGYTYGFSSTILRNKEISPFVAYGSVRANATNASLKIIMEMIGSYGEKFSEEDMEVTKNKVFKRNTMSTESLAAKLNMLRNISKYDLSLDYIFQSQNELLAMSLDDFHAIIDKYIIEKEMVYVVVGDKASQYSEVTKLGRSDVIELDIYGNPI